MCCVNAVVWYCILLFSKEKRRQKQRRKEGKNGGNQNKQANPSTISPKLPRRRARRQPQLSPVCRLLLHLAVDAIGKGGAAENDARARGARPGGQGHPPHRGRGVWGCMCDVGVDYITHACGGWGGLWEGGRERVG